MNRIKFFNHRITNILHTVLLMAGMLVLLTILGLLLGGTRGLVMAALIGFLFLLLSQRMSSQWVLRMAGAKRLDPGSAPGLYRLAGELSRQANLPQPPVIYVVPNQMMNAFTMGGRGTPAIGLTDGLLRRLDSRELAGVMAHEVSHLRHNDTRVLAMASLISRITGLFSIFGQILLFINFPLLLMGEVTISWAAILLMIAAPTISSLLFLALSRTREFDADLGAVQLTGDPIGLASALKKMAVQQQNPLMRIFMPGYRNPEGSIFQTHPSTDDRVKRLLELTGVQPTWTDRELDQILRPSQNWIRPQRRRLFGFWFSS